MTEITYYIADDGTRFEDEQDCIMYEEQLAYDEIKHDLIMFDNQNTIIESPCEISDAEMVVIKTLHAFDCFLELCGTYGCCMDGINKCGLYKWDNNNYVWIDVFKEFHKFRHAIEIANVAECEFEFEAD